MKFTSLPDLHYITALILLYVLKSLSYRSNYFTFVLVNLTLVAQVGRRDLNFGSADKYV